MGDVIRDDFAAGGGWDEGLRMLGLVDVVGVELERWPCETAVAAGHRRVRADVRQIPSAPWTGLDGYVASPPCTSFSAAGKGEGARVLPAIVDAARAVAAGGSVPSSVGGDETTALILQPLRVVRDLRPRWVALEQVPPCLPIWQEYARIFRSWGYCATARVLNAADFGVPQTRRRAILVARLDGPALLPEPTHDEHPGETMFGALRSWISMAEALGWGHLTEPSPVVMAARGRQAGESDVLRGSSWRADWWQREIAAGRVVVDRRTNSRGPGGSTVPTVGVGVDRPAPSFTGKSGTQWVVRPADAASWAWERPATTVCGDPRLSPPCHHESGGQCGNAISSDDIRAWAFERPATTIVGSFSPDVVAAPGYRLPGDGPRQNTPGSIRIQPTEAAVLQSFRPDYPWAGPKTAVFGQIGNAVPPVLAAAVVGALLCLDWSAAVERAS